jgi:hypothetical protein
MCRRRSKVGSTNVDGDASKMTGLIFIENMPGDRKGL